VPPPMGKCEACGKPWDKYRGKRRCPTCGVPSLICRDCYQADQQGTRRLDRSVRCDLCVEQDVSSKQALRAREQRELEEYERRQQGLLLLQPPTAAATTAATAAAAVAPRIRSSNNNPDGVTRLVLNNMCRKRMTTEVLRSHLPGITHVVWRNDRRTGHFTGQGWVEMESPEAAAAAVARSGQMVVLGRPLYIDYQPPGGKDLWPPPHSAVEE